MLGGYPMKTGKCLFLSVFVFLSAVLYAQVLEPGDVDIFINGFLMIDSVEAKDDAVWDTYQEQLEEAVAFLYTWDYEDGISLTDDQVKEIKTKFQKFMKIKVPDELAGVFKSMGWNRNGHEKYWTIMFGVILLMIQSEYGSPGTAKLMEVFHNNDVALIKTVVEKIGDAF